MEKKYIIITGGSGGIGSEITKFLQSKGFEIINLDIKSNKNNHTTNYKCDLSKVNDIKKIFNKIKLPIVGLINCAGITIPGETIKYSISNWNKTLSINLTASFIASQLAAVKMRKTNGGSIINIASISGKQPMPNSTAYNVSKAGIINLSKSLALDFAKYKIRVNSISPGYVKTKMTSKSWKNKKMRLIRTNKTILKKWAEPSDMNEAILFLLDNKKSSYITGSNIIIDGGWLSKGF